MAYTFPLQIVLTNCPLTAPTRVWYPSSVNTGNRVPTAQAAQAAEMCHALRAQRRALGVGRGRARLSPTQAAAYKRDYYDRRIAQDPERLARRAAYQRAYRERRRAAAAAQAQALDAAIAAL